MFGFQRLDVYRDSLEFLGVATRLASSLGRTQAELADQLQRAAMSVPLNIAEGSGKFTRDATRYYIIARGSALECAAIMDVLETLALIDSNRLDGPREVLRRTIARLTRLAGR